MLANCVWTILVITQYRGRPVFADHVSNLKHGLGDPKSGADGEELDAEGNGRLARDHRRRGNHENPEQLQEGFRGSPGQSGYREDARKIDGHCDEDEPGERRRSAGLDGQVAAPSVDRIHTRHANRAASAATLTAAERYRVRGTKRKSMVCGPAGTLTPRKAASVG